MEELKEVTVSEPTVIVEDKGFVDLGLSSGTLWSTTNELADKPEEKGIYGNYGVLEIGVKMPERSFKGRFFYNQIPESRDLPDTEEMEELLEKCVWEKCKLNGVVGMKITGPNGNSIFLPVDYGTDSEEGQAGTYYLTSSVGWSVDEDISMDTYIAVMNAQPISLNISTEEGEMEKDLYYCDFGDPWFLLRTVIPKNRKIKRDDLGEEEKLDFIERNPKAAMATQKRFIGEWDD